MVRMTLFKIIEIMERNQLTSDYWDKWEFMTK